MSRMVIGCASAVSGFWGDSFLRCAATQRLSLALWRGGAHFNRLQWMPALGARSMARLTDLAAGQPLATTRPDGRAGRWAELVGRACL
ncbi:uncharacterized protein BDR25DRAFT_65502 [Lindgomyces ingoldianus]|uniref:Uncharacterized protein n=1 Tax=Lindgomyces ingoldianus TaxID=673940 RepID=A0ACB6RC88_9PLEO|nr:uncharacterized protein BDR25DRAFT_65502 [Lindgomyces ingoldianus]KAF2476378.1 hypothetical protein BDR25DRAFT_65502 [Lindgomyces ingoldianus]